jgi:type IV pilus assembly protein PilW
MAHQKFQNGFTLVELLVAFFVGLIVITAIYAVMLAHQREHGNQRLILQVQQNLRGAMIALEQEIRMAGYDPEDTGQFGIEDIRRYDTYSAQIDDRGQPALFFTADFGRDTQDNGSLEANEHIGFRVRSDSRLNNQYLTMTIGDSGRQRMAGSIESIGFAFAVDCDQDGRCDNWTGSRHLIWAVDSDNDNLLDVHLDTNNDGVIDVKDDSNLDNRITAADGAPIDPPITLDKIKAVRFWLLAASSRPLSGHIDNQNHMVGDTIVPAGKDHHRREVIDMIVECRNL